MLARIFRGRTSGFYIDVGAMDPETDSVTRLLTGWGFDGVNIEPNRRYFARLQQQRPGQINLNVALGEKPGSSTLFEFQDTGLSTLDPHLKAQLETELGSSDVSVVQMLTLAQVCGQYTRGREIDLLKIDVEGWEAKVLAGADFERYRPLVVLMEAITPDTGQPSWETWEPGLLGAGYLYVYSDGVNRFYLRRESEELKSHFQYPPNARDNYIVANVVSLISERDRVYQEKLALQRQLDDWHLVIERQARWIENQANESPVGEGGALPILALIETVQRCLATAENTLAASSWLDANMGQVQNADAVEPADGQPDDVAPTPPASVKALVSAFAEAKIGVRSLLGEVQHVHQELEARKTEVEPQEVQLQQLNESVHELKADLDVERIHARQTEESLKLMNEEMNGLKEERNRLNAEVARLEEIVLSREQALRETLADRQEQLLWVGEVSQARMVLRTEVERLTSCLHFLQCDLNAVNHSQAALRQQCADLWAEKERIRLIADQLWIENERLRPLAALMKKGK